MTTPPAFVPDHCANCLSALTTDNPSLYCDDYCRETSKLVRYYRRAAADGRLADPDGSAAIRVRLAHWLNGGYPASERRLTTSIRAEVIERDRGLCVQCGIAGREVDHIAGSEGTLANLQLLCADCHRAKTSASLLPASPDERLRAAVLIASRVAPAEPVMLADSERWNDEWRQVTRERRGRLVEHSRRLVQDRPGVDAPPVGGSV